ncbi:VirK/YbjX family protein [Undibacterium sp. Jales W-56]|nr:VirK/YbjX family protein [Undibacterium sp. Jales W-56]
MLRTLFDPLNSYAWFRYVRNNNLLKIATSDPSLLDSIHRPFFDRRMRSGDRLSLLMNHFKLAETILGRGNYRSVLLGQKLELASVTGKNHEVFQLRLFRGASYKREGGLSLGLFIDDTLLQCVTFSFDHQQNYLAIKVGGVQASNGGSRDLIRESTKELHGIQPRLLLVEALRYLAQELQSTTIECIAQKNHIYQAWRYKFAKNVKAEYDQLWMTAGGVKRACGNYLLPIMTITKPISSRPSNKRSEYRARAVILEAMRDQISQRLAIN